MPRFAFAGVVALTLSARAAPAAEAKGKVEGVDADTPTPVVTVGDKEQTVPVAKDAEMFRQGGTKKDQPGPKEPVAGGLRGLTAGAEVTVTTETKDGKEVATAVKVDADVVKRKNVK